jgi:hypothetical protein
MWVVTLAKVSLQLSYAQAILPDSGHFLWIVIGAAVVSAFASCLVLEWSSAAFSHDIAASFGSLNRSLKSILADIPCTPSSQAELFKSVILLNSHYQQASFEVRVGRLSGELSTSHVLSEPLILHLVKSVKSLLKTIEYLRREIGWSNAYAIALEGPEDPIRQEIELSIDRLGPVLVQGLEVVQSTVLACYQHSSLVMKSSPVPTEGILTTRATLVDIDLDVRSHLRDVLQPSNIGFAFGDDRRSRPLLNACLRLVSLLQVILSLEYIYLC